MAVLQVICRRSGKKRGRRAAAAGRSHAGPIVSSRENTGPQRAAQAAAGACGSLPAFAGVAYLREPPCFVGEFLCKAMACMGYRQIVEGLYFGGKSYRPPHRISGCLCIHRQVKPTPRIVEPSVFTGEMLEVNAHTSMPPGSLPSAGADLVKSRMRAEFGPVSAAGAVSSDCASVHNLAAVMQHPGDTPSPRAVLQNGMLSTFEGLETSRNTRGK